MKRIPVPYQHRSTHEGAPLIKLIHLNAAEYEQAVLDAGLAGLIHDQGHHALGDVYADDLTAFGRGLGGYQSAVPRAASDVKDLLGRAIYDFLQGMPTPDHIHVQGHDVVEFIVRRRDAVEHLLNIFFLRHEILRFAQNDKNYGTGS